jgi:hypothetical protein
MFDVAGLEGNHDILQYIKPNALAKDLELMMECTTKGYPNQCMMRFPEVYSGETRWDMLKSAIYTACEELRYTLRSIQGDKLTVLTKSAKSGIPVTCWTYSLGCVRAASAKAVKQCLRFLRIVVIMCCHRETIRL